MDESLRCYRTISLERKKRKRPENQVPASDRLTGRIEGQLIALQRIHVGSGLLVPPEQVGLPARVPLLKAFFRSGGRLVIPGSSLKGALRSMTELYSYACVNKTTRRFYGQASEDHLECTYRIGKSDELCPACHVYGARGYAGHLRFGDAELLEGAHEIWPIPPQYSFRPRNALRRYYPYDLCDNRERTWPLEVVTVGSRFGLHGAFHDLSAAELGLALIALGVGQWSLCPRLGAGKAAGLGGVRIQRLCVQRWQPCSAYATYEGDFWEPIDMAACVDVAQPLLRQDVLEQLSDDLHLVDTEEAEDEHS
jgi:CRISPR/Cas system CSM-associated protein Csm3 (group 7 of RAMP superfamily)